MRFLAFLLFCVLPAAACADVYVIYDKNTEAVYTVSEKDDTVVPDGYEKDVLPGTLEDCAFVENPTLYDYMNKKFILSVQRVSEKEKVEQNEAVLQEERKLINDKLTNLAMDALEAEGVVFKYVPRAFPASRRQTGGSASK